MRAVKLAFVAAFAAAVACGSLGSRIAAEPAPSEDPVAAVQRLLEGLPARKGIAYRLSDSETGSLFALGARLDANVFELLDYAYRYLAPRGLRLEMTGESLRSTAGKLVLGNERVYALLPIDHATRIEVGTALAPGQGALDISLDGPYSSFIEIGTAIAQASFGFKRLEPKLFLEPYGLRVRRLFFETNLEKLELYAPRKMAIYVVGLARPKRWNIVAVRERQ